MRCPPQGVQNRFAGLPNGNESLDPFLYRPLQERVTTALVPAPHDQDHRGVKTLKGTLDGIDIGSLGVIVVLNTVDVLDVFQPVMQAFIGVERHLDTCPAGPCNQSCEACSRSIFQVVLSLEPKLGQAQDDRRFSGNAADHLIATDHHSVPGLWHEVMPCAIDVKIKSLAGNPRFKLANRRVHPV